MIKLFTVIAFIGVFSSIGIGFWLIYKINKEMNEHFKKYGHINNDTKQKTMNLSITYKFKNKD